LSERRGFGDNRFQGKNNGILGRKHKKAAATGITGKAEGRVP
jgi:hypothetical protein